MSGIRLSYVRTARLSIVVSRLLQSCYDSSGQCQTGDKKNSGELLLAAVSVEPDTFTPLGGAPNYFPLIRIWSIHWYWVAGTGAPDPP